MWPRICTCIRLFTLELADFRKPGRVSRTILSLHFLDLQRLQQFNFYQFFHHPELVCRGHRHSLVNDIVSASEPQSGDILAHQRRHSDRRPKLLDPVEHGRRLRHIVCELWTVKWFQDCSMQAYEFFHIDFERPVHQLKGCCFKLFVPAFSK